MSRPLPLVLRASLAILVLAALASTASIALLLIERGLGEGHPSWVALGGLAGAVWLAMALTTLRRTLARPSPPES